MRAREWWRGAVVYEVYVRSFRDSDGDGVGDLHGVLEKLDHIADLGVDALWLSPFYPSPMKDFGYDITDMRNVDPLYGSLDDFRQLLEAVHARGLKMLIDFVPCHTSDEHPWFTESRADRDNGKADWYVWADAAPDGGPPNNWLSSFGGSAWEWDARRAQYYYHPFLTCQPALDLRNPAPLQAVRDEMAFWFDTGVDGLRLDAVQCLSFDPDLRSNPPQGTRGDGVRVGGGPKNPFGRQMHMFDRDDRDAMAILESFRETADSYDTPRVLIGELADVDTAAVADRYTKPGRRLHAIYDFDLINVHSDARSLSQALESRAEWIRGGAVMQAFSNHDAVRSVTNLMDFAVREGRAPEAARMLLFLQCCLRGGALIYQGEELGLTHPKLAREEIRDPWGQALWPDFEGRDGARTPMPWVADDPHGGFTDGDAPWMAAREEHLEIAADRQRADPGSVLSFLRHLLAWRRSQPAVCWGDERIRTGNKAPLIVWDRSLEGDALRFVVNFSLDQRLLPIDDDDRGPIQDAPMAVAEQTETGVQLAPLGFCVLNAPR